MVDTATREAEAVLAELDRRIASRSILEHPFYQAWTAGELSREQLATYARMYYPHVEAFPAYLRDAIERAEDAEVRAELQDNLREEESVPAPHPALWLDFAAGLGLDADDVAAARPADSTQVTVDTFRRLCQGQSVEALTALYAYESQQPEVAATKSHGLREFYGIEDDATHRYFTVHAEADVRHREGERTAIARCLEQGASAETLYQAADQALDAYWTLLDGVCAETGISC